MENKYKIDMVLLLLLLLLSWYIELHACVADEAVDPAAGRRYNTT